jgi:hypothetical protein
MKLLRTTGLFITEWSDGIMKGSDLNSFSVNKTKLSVMQETV